jgi:hypothetical protein
VAGSYFLPSFNVSEEILKLIIFSRNVEEVLKLQHIFVLGHLLISFRVYYMQFD